MWKIDINKNEATKNDKKIRFFVDFEGKEPALRLEAGIGKFLISDEDRIALLKHLKDLSTEKLGETGFADYKKVKMYPLEDNIFIGEDGTICTLQADGFYETDFVSALAFINEDIPLILAKMTIQNPLKIFYEDFCINIVYNLINETDFFEIDKDDYLKKPKKLKKRFDLSPFEIEILESGKANILIINDSKAYIYDKNTDYSKVKQKDLTMIKALEGVLYEQKGEYWQFDEVKKRIKGYKNGRKKATNDNT